MSAVIIALLHFITACEATLVVRAAAANQRSTLDRLKLVRLAQHLPHQEAAVILVVDG